MQSTPSTLRLEPFKVACSSCNLRELCLPVGMSNQQLERLDDIVATRRTVPRGEAPAQRRSTASTLNWVSQCGRQASQKPSDAPIGWISSSVGAVPIGRPLTR